MFEFRAKHERSLEDEVAELVSTDLFIAAGDRWIAHLSVLATRPNSADGHARTRILIETIKESVHRLRAFRAVVVGVILTYDTNHNRPAGSAIEDIHSIFRSNSVEGEMARAIDAEMCMLVKQHGAPAGRDGLEDRLNRYREIEALQGALRWLGVGRHAMLPYIEGPVGDSQGFTEEPVPCPAAGPTHGKALRRPS